MHSLFYAATAALGAFLLFIVEPMFAKMIMPRLGGAANVWITAMLFYQLMLLVGYGYAHLLGRFAPWRQWQLHMALVLLAALVLPLAVPANWSPSTQGNPSFALIGMMTLALGAPFAILSATAPLLQRWLFASRPDEDPYVLYAFSNAGSLVALFAYPLLIEPNLPLSAQSRLWTVGFLLFGGALLFAGPFLRKAAHHASTFAELPSRRLALRWLALAALPSSLMLSTTSFLTTNVAGIPLFWVIPLALYLVTFILAFSSVSERAGYWAARCYPMLLIPTIVILVAMGDKTIISLFVLFWLLLAYFAAALLCHCALARLKPQASQLTGFFLVVSFGGALGGAFNSLLAPVMFNDVYEFPLGLALACLALPASGREFGAFALLAAGFAGAASALVGRIPFHEGGGATSANLGLLVIGALALWPIRRFPAPFALGVSLFVVASIFGASSNGIVLSERNFFGVKRVRDTQDRVRVLEHGTTIHGFMALAPEHRLTPLGYYYPAGPLGEATLLHAQRPDARVGVVGLGTGEMACNGDEKTRYDFFEIDPAVIRIASDGKLFPFLTECPAGHRIVPGDGRMQLRRASDGAYDVIIIDAFTSDSIPYHLMTREAIAEYMPKLAPDGLLLLHISSRWFNLSPVLAAEARDLGLAGAIRLGPGGVVEKTSLPIHATLVVALARSPAALAPLYATGWKRLKPLPDVAAWTDDWSDLLSALMLPGRPMDMAWERAEKP